MMLFRFPLWLLILPLRGFSILRASYVATVIALIGLIVAIFTPVHASTGKNISSTPDKVYVQLRPDIQVVSRTVTLGDLFDYDGHQSAVNVIAAPLPGKQIAINAFQVKSFAARHGVIWENPAEFKKIWVNRASVEINQKQIRAVLLEALSENSFGETYRLNLTSRQLTLHVPVGKAPTIIVTRFDLDPNTHQFSAVLSYPSDTTKDASVNVIGRAVQVEQIPMLKNSVTRGNIITPVDVEYREIAVTRIGTNVVTDIADVLGMEARRSLRAGQSIRDNDVMRPLLVNKGAVITMTYDTPGMRLTNVGQALANGAMGEVIAVMNPKSKRTVFAKVIAPNRAEVTRNAMTISAR